MQHILDFILGCRHRRMTRPITAVHKPGAPSGGAWVSCLECGRRFEYDVNAMRVGAPLPATPPAYQPLTSRYQVQ
jgi:hypothetical protein